MTNLLMLEFIISCTGQPPVLLTIITYISKIVGKAFIITFTIETVGFTDIIQEYDTQTVVTIVFQMLMFQDKWKYMCIVDYTSAATNSSVSFTSQPEIVSYECRYNFYIWLHLLSYGILSHYLCLAVVHSKRYLINDMVCQHIFLNWSKC